MPLPGRLGLSLALIAAPPSATAQSLVIEHKPADCLITGYRPRVGACVEPPEAVQEAHVQFRG